MEDIKMERLKYNRKFILNGNSILLDGLYDYILELKKNVAVLTSELSKQAAICRESHTDDKANLQRVADLEQYVIKYQQLLEEKQAED